MENDEKRKIADIVEAFGKINQDIHGAFNVMSNLMEKKKFTSWKKKENGNKNAKDGYYDFKELLEGTYGWYYLNNYGELNGKVIGFTFVIGVEHDEKNDEDYLDFINKLDSNLNPKTPMLCICGVYEPIPPISDSKATKKDVIQLIDDEGWNYVDEVIRITEGWKNFDNNDITLKKWLNIVIDYQDEEGQTGNNYVGWYETAKVKIIQIADISSEENAEKIIDDLFKMAKANDKKSLT